MNWLKNRLKEPTTAIALGILGEVLLYLSDVSATGASVSIGALLGVILKEKGADNSEY